MLATPSTLLDTGCSPALFVTPAGVRQARGFLVPLPSLPTRAVQEADGELAAALPQSARHSSLSGWSLPGELLGLRPFTMKSRPLIGLIALTVCAGVLGLRAGVAGERVAGWSLKPLAEVTPPTPAGLPLEWAQNPIDRFIFAELAKQPLPPSPPADRHSLIRRATYDLTGLPPSIEAVRQFADDPDPDAYEQLIDRLLASPRYGEQWGRHWLDVIRFGESRGFERNEIIRTAWPFRDYVIQSFNDDKPFDRLVLEHLAGDVIGKDDPAVAVGTAFLVAGPYDDVGNQDAAQARLIRANTLDEIVNATSTALLGLTVSCARCHDHKFDPVSLEDYHRFAGIFAGVNHGERTLATPAQRQEREAKLAPLEAQRAAAQKALGEFEEAVLQRTGESGDGPAEFALPAVHPHLTEDRFEPITARHLRINIESNNRNPREGGNVRIDELEVWTASAAPRNIALASTGAMVEGPTRRAEDFAEAYSPSLVIDGAFGSRWISPGPGALTITFASAERIDRIAFSADRQKLLPAESGEIVFVGEYTVEVSRDGTTWTKVADSRQRPPPNESFTRERKLQAALTDADRRHRNERQQVLNRAHEALRAVPVLPLVWAGRFEQPKELTRVFKGGDPERPGDEVKPASISTLAGVTQGFELPADAPESERRLALAKWLVQPDNPLTARVLANRIWHYHFGVGLVDTPSDFGELGGRPTHPELLDWLAHRLHAHGWKLKPLHREIMLSQTYRQSGAWNERAAAVDADTRLLWRFPPRRLGAEELRDTMLTVAGKLDLRAGGPGFQLYRYLQDNVATYLPLDRHGPETYRRAVYHHNARAMVADLMTEFDLPDCASTTPRRASTTSPLQALTLLNHSFTLDLAEGFAQRIEERSSNRDLKARVGLAFELTFQREPDAAELAAGEKLVQDHGLAALCRAMLNSNELLYLE